MAGTPALQMGGGQNSPMNDVHPVVPNQNSYTYGYSGHVFLKQQLEPGHLRQFARMLSMDAAGFTCNIQCNLQGLAGFLDNFGRDLACPKRELTRTTCNVLTEELQR